MKKLLRKRSFVIIAVALILFPFGKAEVAPMIANAYCSVVNCSDLDQPAYQGGVDGEENETTNQDYRTQSGLSTR